MRACVVAIAVALLLGAAASAHAEWTIDADGAFVWEDNLTRAAREADRLSGIAFVPSLTIGYYAQLTDALQLQTSAELKGAFYPEFDGLSHLAPVLTAGLRRKFGLGASAPWLRVFGAAGVLDFGDNVRDGVVLEAGLQAGKRLSERITIQGGYAFESIDTRNDVFTTDAHTVSLKGSVELTRALELSLGYAFRWGDLVVHRAFVPGAPPTAHARRVDTFDRPLVASRIDATTHLLSAVLSYAITSAAAVSVGYEYHHSFGPVFEYPNNLVRAAFTMSF